MRLSIFSTRRIVLPCLAAVALCSPAQDRPIVTAKPTPALTVRRGQTVTVAVPLTVAAGFHINSNQPKDEYLIPLKLTWDKAVWAAEAPQYPEPSLEKYGFSDQPLSVYTGEVTVKTTGKVLADAPTGAAMLTGKVRYQGCNERMCFPPKTLTVSVPVEVKP